MPWRTDFTTAVFCHLILDALEVCPAAGIPCCAAGINVEILGPLRFDTC
jgi:hypothetical protein